MPTTGIVFVIGLGRLNRVDVSQNIGTKVPALLSVDTRTVGRICQSAAASRYPMRAQGQIRGSKLGTDPKKSGRPSLRIHPQSA